MSTTGYQFHLSSYSVRVLFLMKIYVNLQVSYFEEDFFT